MAAIKASGRSDAFQALEAARGAAGERADCAVKAVALATGQPYAAVLELMGRLGRKPGRSTKFIVTDRALAHYGFRAVHVPMVEFIQRYPGTHKGLHHVTTHHPARFPAIWADGQTYLFRTPSHILTVINGVNHDWTRGRALRCVAVHRVEKASGADICKAEIAAHQRRRW
jgi:hypothetical protein